MVTMIRTTWLPKRCFVSGKVRVQIALMIRNRMSQGTDYKVEGERTITQDIVHVVSLF